MKIQLFFILCVVKISFSRSSRKNEAKLEGNVMIERILNADRFDELADKIVSKTLEKLKHDTSMLPDSISTKKPLEPVSVKSVSRQSKKTHKSKAKKIDINAVLQKKVIPFNELIFRYDRFTKNPDTSSKKTHSKVDDNDNKKKHQKTNKENAHKKETTEKLQMDSNEQSDKDISKSQENSESKKNKQTDLSSENMTFNNKFQNESEELKFGNEKLIIWGNSDKKSDETIELDKSIEDQPARQQKGLKETTDIHVRAYSNEQETNENNDKQQKDDEDQTDEAQIKGPSKQAENQSTSIKLPDITEVETISVKVGIVPEHTGEEKDKKGENEIVLRASDKVLMENGEESVKQPLDQSDMKSDDETETLTITESKPKKQKRIVRKEGDKWFALEESPDYAEYHEQLSKMRKSLNKHHKH